MYANNKNNNSAMDFGGGMTKYPYSYEIKTKEGKIITNRMKIAFDLKSSSESKAKKTLKLIYPNCEIIHCKTKTPHNYMESHALVIR